MPWKRRSTINWLFNHVLFCMQKISTEFSKSSSNIWLFMKWTWDNNLSMKRKLFVSLQILFKVCEGSSLFLLPLEFLFKMTRFWCKWKDLDLAGSTSARGLIPGRQIKKVIWWARNKHMIKNTKFKILFYFLIFQILKYTIEFIFENMTQT